jgi:glycosyltransferase involved in cell wall biosynthesis
VTAPAGRASVALAHDYLTQRGGAERVVLALGAAFPGAPVYTTLFHPGGTFPEMAGLDVRTSPLDRVPRLRGRHRLAFPLLAAAAASLRIDAEVAICSSSGWAHAVQVTGRKVVYCHTPARWLYQKDRYLEGLSPVVRPALGVLAPTLRRWDRRAAATAARYLVNSTAVRERVRAVYGVDAEVLPPPLGFDTAGPVQPVDEIEPGFALCVSRLLAYKNVEAVVQGVTALPGERLVVAGSGPLAARLRVEAPPGVVFLGEVDDATLRWLYRSCSVLVSASYDDFGLTPVEAAANGKPSAVLRWGGSLDTMVEGETGVFIERPDPAAVAAALRRVRRHPWDEARLRAHAARWAPERFAARIRAIVEEERAFAGL